MFRRSIIALDKMLFFSSPKVFIFFLFLHKMAMDHEIFSVVILPSADSRRAVVMIWQKPAQEKRWLGELTGST